MAYVIIRKSRFGWRLEATEETMDEIKETLEKYTEYKKHPKTSVYINDESLAKLITDCFDVERVWKVV